MVVVVVVVEVVLGHTVVVGLGKSSCSDASTLVVVVELVELVVQGVLLDLEVLAYLDYLVLLEVQVVLLVQALLVLLVVPLDLEHLEVLELEVVGVGVVEVVVEGVVVVGHMVGQLVHME